MSEDKRYNGLDELRDLESGALDRQRRLRLLTTEACKSALDEAQKVKANA